MSEVKAISESLESWSILKNCSEDTRINVGSLRKLIDIYEGKIKVGVELRDLEWKEPSDLD